MNRKKLKRTILVTVLICAVIYSIMYGIGAFKCYKTLSRFESACNALDVGEVLNCLNPTPIVNISKTIWITTNSIQDFLATEEIQNVINEAMEIIDIELPADTTQQGFSDVNMDVQCKIPFIGIRKANVKATVFLEVKGVELEKQVQINMIKKNGKWYLSGFKLLEK